MQNIKNRKLIPFYFVPLSRYNLTEVKNIDMRSGQRVNNNDKKMILRYLANKIGTNIVINRVKMRPRIFIVGIYSSAFLQKLVIKFLNTH